MNARQHKGAWLALQLEQDCAEALAVLARLKLYALPPVARTITESCAASLIRWENCELMDEFHDPMSILHVLRDIERELIAIGGPAGLR